MKKLLAIVLSCLMIFTLAACGGGSGGGSTTAGTQAPDGTTEAGQPEAPADTSPIKIGSVGDLTGNEATTGEEANKALEFAIEYFGGEICGRTVELVKEDAKGDAATAADVARKMVEQDGVAAVFGPTQAGQKASVVAYMDEAEVPLIFFNGTPSYLFNQSQWLIGAGGTNPQMTSVMADYAYNTLGYRTVNILTMDNTGFRAFSDDFATSFKALGGEIAQEIYVPFSVGDWSSYFASMTTDGVDGIMAWSTGATAISMWKSYSEMGMADKLPITAIMSSAFTDYYIGGALAGSGSAAAEDIIGTVAPISYSYDIESAENEEFVKAWEEKFGSVPNTNLSGLIFDAYQAFVKAVESTNGDTSPEVLREALLAVNFDGVTGSMSFDENGAAIKDVYIVEVERTEAGYNYHTIDKYEKVGVWGLDQ